MSDGVSVYPTHKRQQRGAHSAHNALSCECNSAVESRFSKPMVVGSNPIVRFCSFMRLLPLIVRWTCIDHETAFIVRLCNGSTRGSGSLCPSSNLGRTTWLCTQVATRADCKSADIVFGGSSPSATICHLSTAAVHRICNARVMSSNLIGGFHGPIV